MQVANQGDDLGGRNAPDNNADIIALFASGTWSNHARGSNADCFVVCKLTDDPNNPRKVDVEDRIVPRPLPK
jgi:hypothetical protein